MPPVRQAPVPRLRLQLILSSGSVAPDFESLVKTKKKNKRQLRVCVNRASAKAIQSLLVALSWSGWYETTVHLDNDARNGCNTTFTRFACFSILLRG